MKTSKPTPSPEKFGAPESYARTMDILRHAETLYRLRPPVSESVRDLTARVSARLLDTGDGEAAAVIDGLAVAMKSIAGYLETRGGHARPATNEAYRTAMALVVE